MFNILNLGSDVLKFTFLHGAARAKLKNEIVDEIKTSFSSVAQDGEKIDFGMSAAMWRTWSQVANLESGGDLESGVDINQFRDGENGAQMFN